MMGGITSSKSPKDLETKCWGGGEDELTRCVECGGASSAGAAQHPWPGSLYEGDSGLVWGEEARVLGEGRSSQPARARELTLQDQRYPCH